jgi:hypothetical protein
VYLLGATLSEQLQLLPTAEQYGAFWKGFAHYWVFSNNSLASATISHHVLSPGWQNDTDWKCHIIGRIYLPDNFEQYGGESADIRFGVTGGLERSRCLEEIYSQYLFWEV